MAELDSLLERAGAEVQRGLDQGYARIGRYTLVTPLGEGGFGTVWLASQDEPVRRLVALKILRRDPGSRMILARFQNERQALARMDHPNVASVLDAGVTEDGRPWFAMPFIDGMPITQACDDARVGIRERVRLLAETCDGVQHAHRKGIIHRDLKPGNVLVARNGDVRTAKVIDFGVAKALESTDPASLRTADGQRLGTPQYMPPEQWLHGAGVADVRSDVYALGAVLAELLVGGPPVRLPRTPLDVPEVIAPSAWLGQRTAADPAAAARIADDRGTDAAGLLSMVRGDLDSVVRRATAQHPDDRYPSPAALAEDLRRWLDGLPVGARVTAPWERAWRSVRRHPRTSVLAGVAALGTVALASLWVVSSRRSVEQAAQVEAARIQSERTFAIARDTIQGMVDEVLTSRDPERLASVFERAERMVDRIARDDPFASVRLASVVARGHMGAWDRRAAVGLLNRSLDRIVALDPDGTSEAFRELAEPYFRSCVRGDRESGRDVLMAAMAPYVARGELAEPHVQEILRLGIQELVPWPPAMLTDDPEVRLALADLYASWIDDPRRSALQLALHRISALTRAETMPNSLEEAHAALNRICRDLPADDPSRLHAELQWGIMNSIRGHNSSDALQGMMYLAARAEHAFGTGSPRTVNIHWNLAFTCIHAGDAPGAYDAFARFLWPEMRRLHPGDGLRRWYLSYFAPVAYEACALDDAWAAGMQVLADDAQDGEVKRDGMAQQAAHVVAAVLAEQGDEAGAAEIERIYGVRRMVRGE